MEDISLHVKDREVTQNSQHRLRKLHLGRVITYYDETTGGTAENVIYFLFLKTFTSVT